MRHHERLRRYWADRRAVHNDEATFAEFVKDAPRTEDAYRRWRLLGIPVPWLKRAGYPPSPPTPPREEPLP